MPRPRSKKTGQPSVWGGVKRGKEDGLEGFSRVLSCCGVDKDDFSGSVKDMCFQMRLCSYFLFCVMF